MPEACARLPFRLLSGDPVAKEPAGSSWSRIRLPASAAIVRAAPEARVPTEFCTAFRRLPRREAPRSVIHTVALIEECNRAGGSETENEGSAVGMLFGSAKCCGAVWKTRSGLWPVKTNLLIAAKIRGHARSPATRIVRAVAPRARAPVRRHCGNGGRGARRHRQYCLRAASPSWRTWVARRRSRG